MIIGGGCINNALKVDTNTGRFFLKWNVNAGDMFEAEADGLKTLQNASTIKIPAVLGLGSEEEKDYLLLEWVENGVIQKETWKIFGQQLALMHRTTQDQHGYHRDNYIGSLAQINSKHPSWHSFFIEERLMPQLRLARSKKLVDKKLSDQFESLFSKLGELIPAEKPALLHGDLWSGNYMITAAGEPCIFDPAVYFGHRETELAFTTLFGGFDREFYLAYNEQFPLEKGFEDRIDIHNLYPLLVHVNLFGTSYLSGVVSTLKKYA